MAKETVRLRVILLVAMSLLLMQSESPLSGEKVQALRAKLVTASIWVRGAPLWVAITVTNLSDHEMRGPVKSVFPFTQEGIRWELRSTDSGKVLVQKTRPGLKYVPGEMAEDYAGRQRDVKWPVHHVGVGESMRFLFPLSWSDDVKPGKYGLSVVVLERNGEDLVQSEAVQIDVRMPDAKEREALQKLVPIPLLPGKNEEGLEFRDLPPSLAQSVGFQVVFRRAIVSQTALARQDADAFRLGHEYIFEPELLALRYEVLLARGEKTSASLLRKGITERFPEATWIFREIETGQGPISTARRILKDEEPQPTAPGTDGPKKGKDEAAEGPKLGD